MGCRWQSATSPGATGSGRSSSGPGRSPTRPELLAGGDLGALRAPDHDRGRWAPRRSSSPSGRSAVHQVAGRGSRRRRGASIDPVPQPDARRARRRPGDRHREGDRRGARRPRVRDADHALGRRDDTHPPAPGRPRARGAAPRAPGARDRRPVRDDHPRRPAPARQRHERARPRRRGALRAARQPGRDAGGAARRRADRRPRSTSGAGERDRGGARARLAALRLRARLGAASPSTTSSARRWSRCSGIPHAETNATMLPRTMEAMRSRAPEAIASLAAALGASRDEIAVAHRVARRRAAPARRPRRRRGSPRDRSDAILARARARQHARSAAAATSFGALIESAW